MSSRVPTVHARRNQRAVAALPWLALGLPTASSLTLAFLSEQPMRTAWALVGLGCGGLLLLWASLRPSTRPVGSPSEGE